MKEVSIQSRLRPARAGELRPGTPEHFLAYVRGEGAMRTNAVEYNAEHPDCPEVLVVKIPADGAWMFNGLHVVAGTTIELVAGSKLSYHPTTRGNDQDDRALAVERAPIFLDRLPVAPSIAAARQSKPRHTLVDAARDASHAASRRGGR